MKTNQQGSKVQNLFQMSPHQEKGILTNSELTNKIQLNTVISSKPRTSKMYLT